MSESFEVQNGEVTLVGDHWAAEGERRGTVVLLHGGAQRRFSWHRTGERLARHGWDAYAFDARGHGDSSWAPDGDYSGDASVADLGAVVAHVGEAPVLVGASMGGMTSLQAVAAGPAFARALVMVDVVARMEPTGTARILEFMSGAPDGFGSLEEAADAIAAYNPHRARPSSLEGLKKNLRQRENGRWYWHWDPAMLGDMRGGERRRDPDFLERAARSIAIPTLLVRGGSSDVVSEEGLAHMRALVPHAEVAEVAKTGHMIAGDDNDVFTERLTDFLARV